MIKIIHVAAVGLLSLILPSLVAPKTFGYASAQVATLNDAAPSGFNSDFNSSSTASGTISNVGTGSGSGGWNTAQFDFGFAVSGSTTWLGGVEFQLQDGVQQIWTQPTATDLDNGDGGVYLMNFTRGVGGLTFYHGGLDNDDTVLMRAFYQGNPVTLQSSYFSDFTGGVFLESNDTVTARLRGPSSGNGDERQREYLVTFPDTVLVDELQFEVGKAPQRGGAVTLGFYLFNWLPLTISAEDDTGPTVLNATASTGVMNVLSDNGSGGDTLDDPNTSGTDAALASTVTASPTGVPPAGITLNADGTVDVAGGTTPGSYSIPYEICEIANPTNCASATFTLDVTDTVIAANDVVTTPTAGPVTVNPLTNDTGGTLDPLSVVLTGTGAPAGSVLASDGKTLDVPGEGTWTVASSGEITFSPLATFSGSPTPAAYTVDNTLSMTSNEATVSVNIAAQIVAVADPFPTMLESNGGTTQTVLANDTVAGAVITNPALVTLTPGAAPTPPAGSITMNADGTISVASGTPSGIYDYTYQICDAANPTNCATATATLEVSASTLIQAIEEDLKEILEVDRAAALAQQSAQMSRYAADARDRLGNRGGAACTALVNALLESKGILFDTDKAIIKPQSYSVLDDIADLLQSCRGQAFEIAGHTDSDASDAYNLALSQRRVDAVLRALEARDVDVTGFIARGYGESQPIANNATPAGKARNRRVEFNSIGTQAQHCKSDQTARAIDASANGSGATVDGSFLHETHDCARNVREVFEGSVSYLDTDQGQAQSMVNLSYRRETLISESRVRGYFLGLYSSQTDVLSTAEGNINGVGINAGVYGADRLRSGLMFDYYLGTALGRHSYALTFDNDLGEIEADGEYAYSAAFAGAALSGDLAWGDKTVTPRAGVDYVYSLGTETDLTARMGSITETGTVDLGTLSGGRVFAELKSTWMLDDGKTTLGLTPRIACYESIGGLDGACGLGGTIGLSRPDHSSGWEYGMELDFEGGADYRRATLTGTLERQIGERTRLHSSANIASKDDVSLVGGLDMSF